MRSCRHLLLLPLLACSSLHAEENGQTGKATEAAAPAPTPAVAFDAGLKIDSLNNRGAIRNGSRTVSHIDLKLKLDLEKLVRWNGGSMMLNLISDSGIGPNTRLVGSQMGVTNIEIGSPTTTRLFQAWLQQSAFDERFALLAGIYPIDSEFFGVDSAAVFLGPQYGTPADLAQTRNSRGPSIFNNAGFGFRMKLQTAAKTVYGMGAVVDGIPNDPRNPKRTAVRFEKGDGAFNIGEIGWLPFADDEKYQGHAKLAAGVWRYTVRVDDQLDRDAAGNPVRRYSQGGYLLAEKTVSRLDSDPNRYLSVFGRVTGTDGDSTTVRGSVNLGLHVHGPAASRPEDIAAVAYTRAGLSRKWRDSQAASGTATTAFEDAVEWTYRYTVNRHVSIQPNLQYIRNPGGTLGTPRARLIGARLEFAL